MSKILKATHGSDETPLRIGDLEILCYVLEDGTRVLSQRGVNKAFGVSEGGGNASDSAQKLPRFLSSKALEPFISADLLARISEPIKYIVPGLRTKTPAHGIPATVLPEICKVWVQARDAGTLKTKRQFETAGIAEILLGGLQHVGIIALVDEATGYQAERSRYELHKILEAYVAKEFLPWTKRFPDTFYEEMFRLNGWHYSSLSSKRPPKVGEYTEDWVYRRLPAGVLDEIRKKNPKTEKGYRKRKHHQFLSEDIGNPHLERHLASVITLMKVSPNRRKFTSLLNRAFPLPDQQYEFAVEPDEDE